MKSFLAMFAVLITGCRGCREQDAPLPYSVTVDLAGCEAQTVYLDQDRDGYGDPSTAMLGCTAPEDSVGDGTDCDDEDSAINPGAEAICADTLDNDCDGAPDCPEVSGRTSLDEATAVLVDQEDGAAGDTLIADFSGDGFNDYLIAAPYAVEDGYRGRMYVVLGPVRGGIDLTSDDVPDISSDAVNTDAYWSASGDLDGDGYRDILSASADEYENIVFLASGPFGDRDVQLDTEATARLTQPYDDDDEVQGNTQVAVGDVLGEDGQDDLLLARRAIVDETAAAFFVAGPLPEEGVFTEISEAMLYLIDEGEREGFLGTNIVGDINGDGVPEVSASAGGEYIFVYFELPPGESEAFDLADVMIYGEGVSTGDQLVGAGDVDGDGLSDLLSSSADPDDIYWGAGDKVYIFSSITLNDHAGGRTLDIEGDYLALFDGSIQLGMGIGTPGDMNRDGYAEVFLGEPDNWDGEDDETGYASLWYGPVEGTYAGPSGDIYIKGEELGSRTGWRVAASPGDDVNNPVLLVGTWPANGVSTIYQFTPDGY